MSTYREIVYMCMDQLKLASDDADFTEDHLVWLADKFRAFLLKQKYSDLRKEVPEANYQTLCLSLQEVNGINGEPCDGTNYLKSIDQIPYLILVGNPRVYSTDYYQGDITLVSRDRMRYVGHNKYLQNIIYGSIAPDSHLYLKSMNPQFYYLEKVKFTAIFENGTQASELGCDELSCIPLDRNFPLEEPLIPILVDLIVKELSVPVIKPDDDTNNASDDLDKSNGK